MRVVVCLMISILGIDLPHCQSLIRHVRMCAHQQRLCDACSPLLVAKLSGVKVPLVVAVSSQQVSWHGT